MEQPLEILLVEDNEGDVEMTRRALAREEPPCNLSVTNNGAEALDYLCKRGKFQNASLPHLIFLDLNMPRMSGKEFLKVVKQDEQLKYIPIMVLTSSKAKPDIIESYALHANGYIVKPFDSKDFMNTLKQTLNFWRNIVLLPSSAAML